MKKEWFAESIIGNYRKDNEDKFIFLENKFISLVVICDGIGGYLYGKLASKITVDEIKKRFNEYNFDNFSPSKAFEWLEESVAIIFNKMLEIASSDDNKLNMGTTCLLALIIKHNIYLLNIGDCRLYIYCKTNDLKKITNDQNLLNQIGWDRCQRNPNIAKLLTSSLGPTKKIKIDKYQINNVHGQLLFSTDGFHDYVSISSIKNILKNNSSLKLKVSDLINLAVSNVSKDNITVLLMKL